jgi:hypothetical protein
LNEKNCRIEDDKMRITFLSTISIRKQNSRKEKKKGRRAGSKGGGEGEQSSKSRGWETQCGEQRIGAMTLKL